MSTTVEGGPEVRLAELSEKIKFAKEAFTSRMDTQDKVLQEIKDTLEKVKPKPVDIVKVGGMLISLAGVLIVAFAAVAYPIRRDIDDNRKVTENNREITAKDLALIRADFESVKRENIWNWDGMKTRLDNQTKQLDRTWQKVFGTDDKPK